MRLFYFSIACIAFSAGIIGAFLPVIPTTPFMLLALWGFSRSSPRFHQWLYTHKLFGPPLQQWQQYRVIPPLAKYGAVFSMLISLGYLAFFTTIPLWLKLLAAAMMAYGAWFVLTKPSYPAGK